MAGINYTSQSASVADKALNGGLNSTAGPFGLKDNESSDLQNIDYDQFGSILKRSGYANLNTTATSGSNLTGDGLYFYEYNNAGTATRYLTKVSGGKFYYMIGLNGTWNDITGALSITSPNQCDFETFLNEVYVTNGVDVPFKWTGTGNGAAMTVPANLTTAKYVCLFNNYLFLGNVTVGGVTYPSRVYFSNIKSTTTWSGTDWIEIAMNDGQQIQGLRVLGDRLVVYKDRAIYNMFFTGDADIPFILPGGGKSNSNVGCIAPFSIADVENYHVFLATDGLYIYDGLNSQKISNNIRTTLQALNTTRYAQARAATYRLKNRYMIAFPSASQTTNDTVIVWDYYNNAFSIYKGMAISAITNLMSGGTDERTYFTDYKGFDYQMDTGVNDYPLQTSTAIACYYWTNWRAYDDLISQKGIPEVVIYYKTNNTTLTFGYSYDFETSTQYSNTFSMSAGTAVYGSAIYGTDVYAGSGGASKRRDLTGRGRVVRFLFQNNNAGETFRIDGIGALPHLETAV